MNDEILEKIQILTVSELNLTTRLILEEALPTVWVEGEISNLARPSSGHLYFTLKDAKSQVRCAMFNGRNRNLKFNIENGLQVLVRAEVTLYEARGDYQLIVEQIDPAGGGALQLAFEQLKQKLIKEGLFDRELKKPLPFFPTSIGVITSPTGAAIRDILSVLKRRYPMAKVIIYPTAVQGEGAANQIVQALEMANQRNECDVLIVARGGGSLEDLWPFNEEKVARAIYASELPIVSGVGHEVDFTIADFVADERAPTPSAAAELVSPDQEKLKHDLNHRLMQLTQLVQHRFLHWQNQIQYLQQRLRHPAQILREKSQQIDFLEKQLLNAVHRIFQIGNAKLIELSRALDAISPLATLQRGYAIVTKTGTTDVVEDIKKIKPNDKIDVKLHKGVLHCQVENVEKSI